MKASKLFGSQKGRDESEDLAADNVCTKSLHWPVAFAFCEQAGEEGLCSLPGLGAEGFGHPGEKGPGGPAHPLPWGEKPVEWLLGCSSGLPLIWHKFPGRMFAD